MYKKAKRNQKEKVMNAGKRAGRQGKEKGRAAAVALRVTFFV